MGADLGGWVPSMGRGPSAIATGVKRECGRQEWVREVDTTGSDSQDLGREEENQLDLGEATGEEEEGVVRSVLDEDAEEVRNESHDDVLGIDDDDDDDNAGDNGGGDGAVHAKHGGDDLRGG
jgi:hypothetical protein